ncbi:MAG: hypothetical protein H6981_14750 [Gammaproteobacteria bacterium]|nr:hypothetical protein [Gammaproteobacteria bacterium]MCP5138043.1 hypothetical protein [Gammaproteobacteria bacterium]
MSNDKVSTVQDRNGDVWTGREVRSGIDSSDMVATLITGGLALPTLDASKTTVSVNGVEHTGHKVK